jgi:SOS response regulatory protein OraA/RecX
MSTSTFRVSPEMRRLLEAERKALAWAARRQAAPITDEQIIQAAEQAPPVDRATVAAMFPGLELDRWPQEAREIAAAHLERAEKWDEPPCTCGACRFTNGRK